MKLICLGDSNTYGYDPRSWLGGRYPADSRWVDILAAKTGWEVLNLGQNGREIPRQAPTLPPDTDLLILMLGTNDLLQGRTPSQAIERLERFLSGLALAPVKTLLIAPPPLKPGVWVSGSREIEDSLAFAEGCRALAGRLGILFAGADRWEIPLAYDGVHFTEQGHRAFAQALFGTLESLEVLK